MCPVHFIIFGNTRSTTWEISIQTTIIDWASKSLRKIIYFNKRNISLSMDDLFSDKLIGSQEKQQTSWLCKVYWLVKINGLIEPLCPRLQRSVFWGGHATTWLQRWSKETKELVCVNTALNIITVKQLQPINKSSATRGIKAQGEQLAREGQWARERAERDVFRGKINLNFVVPDQKWSLR